MVIIGIPIQSFALENQINQGYEITDSGVPIQEIDKLIEERTAAQLMNDKDQVDILSDSLSEYGLNPISRQEINKLDNNSSSAIAKASSNVKFETINTTYTVNGVKYKIKRIYATPIGQSNIYKTGVTTLTNSKSASAIAMNFFKTTVSCAAGIASDTISIAQSAYSAFSGIVNGLKTTSTINNIKATYTWNTAETCAFIYFLNPTTDAYILKVRYSKVSYGVGASIPVLTVDGKDASAKVIQKAYSGSATPKNYNNTYQAYLKFKNGGIHTAQINSINVKGVEGKTVKSIKLTNPQEPAEIL